MSIDRLESIRSILRETGDDGLFITTQEDVRWTCGFTGSNAALLITEDYAVLFTDGRYSTQAPSEVHHADVEIVSGDLTTAAGWRFADSPLKSIAVDGESTSIGVFRRLQTWPGEPRIRPYDTPLARLQAQKTPGELERLRRAQRITDKVFDEILGLIEPGITEKELAAEIVYRHLRHGAERMSFDPIVASGENGALPHARPSNRAFGHGDLVVLDFGCFADGYASDMTRTVAVGQPHDDALAVYATVQDAQAAAQSAARSRMRACDLDAVARSVIEQEGLGAAFRHGLGHGIGLRIHEFPRLAATNEAPLPDNAVVTIEPGVYIPGRFGVRIENAVILRPEGCEPLPGSSTDLIRL
jgi:Xaa-Pro aminopeptidase